MNDSIAAHGPFKVEITFFMTDGNYEAHASCDMPAGVVPTEESIAELAASVQAQFAEQNDQFKWMGRHEFVNAILKERNPMMPTMSIPGPDKFEAEWAISPEVTEQAE